MWPTEKLEFETPDVKAIQKITPMYVSASGNYRSKNVSDKM